MPRDQPMDRLRIILSSIESLNQTYDILYLQSQGEEIMPQNLQPIVAIKSVLSKELVRLEQKHKTILDFSGFEWLQDLLVSNLAEHRSQTTVRAKKPILLLDLLKKEYASKCPTIERDLETLVVSIFSGENFRAREIARCFREAQQKIGDLQPLDGKSRPRPLAW